MSIMYFLAVELNLKYATKNMGYLLENFAQRGCIFIAQEEDKNLVADSYFLTPEQALMKIVDATEKVRYLSEDTLFVKYRDTYFQLRLYKKDNDLLIASLSFVSCPWGKNFWYGKERYMIDFARYAQLIMDITQNVSLLGLEVSSDHSDEWPENREKNCIVAVIDMGSLNDSLSGVMVSLSCIIRNGFQNNIIFFDDKTGQSIVPSVQKYYDIFKLGFPLCIYAKKDNIPFKIEIKQNIQGYEGVLVYPLEPYRMKKDYGNEEEKINVAFYVQRLLELCENFAIYELKTFF